MSNYLTLLNIFEDYEKHALLEYIENNEDQLVFYNPKNSEICKKIINLQTNLKNPFLSIYDWIQFEILDMTAMSNALESIDYLTRLLEQKKAELQTINKELQNINSSFSKIKLIIKFKSKESYQEELLVDRVKTEELITNLDELIKDDIDVESKDNSKNIEDNFNQGNEVNFNINN